MRCRMPMLTLGLLALSPGSCQHVTDSFCQVYRPVVQQKGDGAITAPSGVKKRILANELTYRGQCRAGT